MAGAHGFFALVIAGGCQLGGVLLRHELQISGQAFEQVGQVIAGIFAQSDLYRVPGQAGMIVILIDRKSLFDLG